MRELLLAGADKVSLNTAALARPGLIEEAAARFGSQCVVCAIDARRDAGGGWRAYVDGGRRATDWDAIAWAAHAVELGAGEILMTSMDSDGVQDGYDLELVRTLCDDGQRAGRRLRRRGQARSTSPTRSRPAPRRRSRRRSSMTEPTRSRRRRPPAARAGCRCDERRSRNA